MAQFFQLFRRKICRVIYSPADRSEPGTVAADNTVRDFQKIPVGRVFSTKDPLADLTAFLNGDMDGMISDLTAAEMAEKYGEE